MVTVIVIFKKYFFTKIKSGWPKPTAPNERGKKLDFNLNF